MSLSRRDFIRLSSLAGASLVLEIGCGSGEPGEPFRASQWLTIHPNGGIELYVNKLEMGQGIRTGLALIVAEELEIDPRALVLLTPSTEGFFASGTIMHTGSSVSTSSMWDLLRETGATARQMLTTAAARKWGVPVGACRADNGTIRHDASARSLGYGDLATLAVQEKVPRRPTLKERSEFRWMGRPTPRLEGPDIVTGRQPFGCDVRLPGQRYAVVARPPAPGDKLKKIGKKEALKVDGVEAVHRIRNSIAVVADSTWSAMEGRDKLNPTWRPGPASDFSTSTLQEDLERDLEAPKAAKWRPDLASPHVVEVHSTGDAVAALAGAGKGFGNQGLGNQVLERRYSTPYHTHVPMEPKNALVRLEEDFCEIWCGTQKPNEAQRRVASFLGFPTSRVLLHPQHMGGAFGQKEPSRFVVEAAALARAIGGGPVQIMWTREDDIADGYYHPPSRHRIRAAVDDDGRITGWHHRVALPSIEKLWEFGRDNPDLVPAAETAGAWNMPYSPENCLVEWVDPVTPIPLCFWRGVEIVPNSFAVEGFIDELAEVAGVDPVEFRLRNFGTFAPPTVPTGEPPYEVSRLARALELVAEYSGWGTPLPPGRGRGVAAIVFDGRTACASVAEVTVEAGELRVDRFVCVLDCGFVVNPLGLAGNAESAVTWGLSAMFSEITFQEGKVVERSHLDYPILRFPEMPRVEIHTVPSDAKPSGTGEMPTPTVAPAVVNAIYAATGTRIRHLPIRPGDLESPPDPVSGAGS